MLLVGIMSITFKQWLIENKRESVIDEFIQELNPEIDFESISVSSGEILNWRCSKGHEWSAVVYSRKKNNCPVCAGKKIVPGLNDLQTLNPNLAMEWDLDNELKVNEVSPNSHKTALWICKSGHKWEAQIKSRNRGSGCPYCSGTYVSKGVNDFQTCFPDISKQWCEEKNDLSNHPSNCSKKSNKKVWWRCPDCGYEWRSTYCDRATGKGCLKCSAKDRVSLGEKAIVFYLRKITDVEESYHNPKFLKKMELDIFLPKLNIAIEYDGAVFHGKSRLKSDLEKNKLCSENGITLIRVREDGCPLIDNCISIFVKPGFGKNLNEPISEIIGICCKFNIKNEITVDIERDLQAIMKLKYDSKVKNSLGYMHPDLVLEWHQILNNGLNPMNVPAQSNEKAWWQCSKGHEWEAQISSRVHGNGCPYCCNKLVMKGFNDLATLCPELAKEWHPTKNGELLPSDVSRGSKKKVWWQCFKGHEWEAAIYSRSSGRNCPYCINKKILTGFNDLATLCPELAKEWHPTKNGELSPFDVSRGSDKKVWWLGSCGHEWIMEVSARTGLGKGCPACNGNFGVPEYNLITEVPLLKKYWDYSKNEKPPEFYRPNSGICVNWTCELNHHWNQSISEMARIQKCLYCSGRRLLSGFNDLKTKYPDLVKEWDYERNAKNPDQYLPGSNEKVWWICSNCGRSWNTQINVRAMQGHGCSSCSSKGKPKRNSVQITHR